MRSRIDPAYRAICICYMIGNVVVVVAPVEIGQDEEASEPESSPPKRRWDPVI